MNRVTNKDTKFQAVFAAAKVIFIPIMGYLFMLLLASALLGLFISDFAYRSGWAAIAGVALGGYSVSQPWWISARGP